MKIARVNSKYFVFYYDFNDPATLRHHAKTLEYVIRLQYSYNDTGF